MLPYVHSALYKGELLFTVPMPSPWYPIKEICSHLTLEETEDQREYDLEGHEMIKLMLP